MTTLTTELNEMDESNQWDLIEDGSTFATVEADDIESALALAADSVDPSNYETDETMWVRVYARNRVTGECDSVKVQVDPPEPQCVRGASHDWRDPLSVVGGFRENPGVVGHGGGVLMRSVCACCRVYRIHDTWAQDRVTGEQGLQSVRYEPADDASLAWDGE